jgi:hypothetical protein
LETDCPRCGKISYPNDDIEISIRWPRDHYLSVWMVHVRCFAEMVEKGDIKLPSLLKEKEWFNC